MISQGEYESAKNCFVKCINTGQQYDPRIRQECVNQLRTILSRDNVIDLKLEKLAESFRYRHRDFVFLINQSMTMNVHKDEVIEILKTIMTAKEDSIENLDRVSLIKFNKRLRRIFSLVQKDSNFA